MDEATSPYHIRNALRRIDERLQRMLESCEAGDPIDLFEIIVVGRQALAQAEMLKAGLTE